MNVESMMEKLGNQIRWRERQCAWMCVSVCKISLLKRALCWMLIRDNKISIKDLFWTDRVREGQMIERGGHEPARRWKGKGGGDRALWFVSQSGLYQRHLFPPISARLSLTDAHTGAQTVCILIALSPPAVQADNGFLSRLSFSKVSFVLPDRPKHALTGKLATITGPICVITELWQNLAQQAEGLLFQNVSCAV